MKIKKEKNHLVDFDIFATPVRSLNFKGRANIGSCLGLTCTLFTVILMTSFLATELVIMIRGDHPNISEIT
jgi:hypothetical protein